MPSKRADKRPPSDSDDEDASSDEDFNPESQAVEDEESVSSSEDEVPTQQVRGRGKGTKRKRGAEKDEAEAIELDSGDEVTINERKKKKRQGGDAVDSGDEDGEGGFVRTRAQRRVETIERRPLASTAGSTIDVESIWAKLASIPIGPSVRPPNTTEAEGKETVSKPVPEKDEDLITIKRTIRYAGEVSVEEKRVHKHSAEAKLYLKEQEEKKRKKEKADAGEEETVTEEPEKVVLRRPLKRPSRFEPNPTGEVKTLPPHLQLRWPRDKKAVAGVPGHLTAALPNGHVPKKVEATKLNTVDKSRYDWAGFVDKEGIAEELDEYGKSKGSYLGREEFLSRAQQRQDQDARDARVKAR